MVCFFSAYNLFELALLSQNQKSEPPPTFELGTLANNLYWLELGTDA